MTTPFPHRSIVPALSLVLFAAACGGADASELHSTFAAIQVEEARIERADASATTCDERRAACADTCDAAHRIDTLASGVDDRDARARADRAVIRCESCRAVIATSCEEAS